MLLQQPVPCENCPDSRVPESSALGLEKNIVPHFLVPWVPLCADPVSWSYRGPLEVGGTEPNTGLAWSGLSTVLEPIALYDTAGRAPVPSASSFACLV